MNRDSPHPYALVTIGDSIKQQQAYDILVQLEVPKSPRNSELGNFMLDMVMLAPSYKQPVSSTSNVRSFIPADTILYSSRRPAILTYRSELVGFAGRVLGLPWYLTGWRREAEKLRIPMAEAISFDKSKKSIPSKVYLEIQTTGEQSLEVYNMQLLLRARFSGLRWVMYNFRTASFFVFTAAFWVAEVIFTVLAWILLQAVFHGDNTKSVTQKGEIADEPQIKREKQEDDELDLDDLDLSDTPRDFPTYGRQAPLKYVPRIKVEDEELVSDEVHTHPRVAEADDESEDPVDVGLGFRGNRSDSGLGTSYSEGGDRGSEVSRRRSHKTAGR
jgi:hypothetical protein